MFRVLCTITHYESLIDIYLLSNRYLRVDIFFMNDNHQGEWHLLAFFQQIIKWSDITDLTTIVSQCTFIQVQSCVNKDLLKDLPSIEWQKRNGKELRLSSMIFDQRSNHNFLTILVPKHDEEEIVLVFFSSLFVRLLHWERLLRTSFDRWLSSTIESNLMSKYFSLSFHNDQTNELN